MPQTGVRLTSKDALNVKKKKKKKQALRNGEQFTHISVVPNNDRLPSPHGPGQSKLGHRQEANVSSFQSPQQKTSAVSVTQ